MKSIIIVLVVVLLLFGIMMACGLSLDHNGRASDRPFWMSPFDLLQKKSPVTASDLLPAACLMQGDAVAHANTPCAVRVRTSGSSNVRTMKMVMEIGHSAKLELQTHGQAGIKIDITLRSAGQISPEMQIPQEGAELTITCTDPAADPTPGSPLGQLPGCRLRLSK